MKGPFLGGALGTKPMPSSTFRAMVAWLACSSGLGGGTAMDNDGMTKTGQPASAIVLFRHPRTNTTHLVWRKYPSLPVDVLGSSPSSSSRGLKGSSITSESTLDYEIQSYQDACQESMNFLRDNLMEFDRPFLETLGFPVGEDTTDAADGLGNGLVGATVQLALQAKRRYPWTDALPKNIFQEYVLNFANLNEARTNWRPLLVDALRFNESDLWLSGDANLTSTVTWVNQQLWTRLGKPDNPIYFQSGQTPLIFDPMSTIAFGYASCTGTSILFANALRAVGIPARVVGTPAWYGNRTMGNHNWVEVYVGADDARSDGADPWKFLEPSPANAGLDTLDKDPCERWFCQASRYPSSRVYAAKLVGPAGDEAATYFPLAWAWHNQDVPGVDRTQYYTDICKFCT